MRILFCLSERVDSPSCFEIPVEAAGYPDTGDRAEKYTCSVPEVSATAFAVAVRTAVGHHPCSRTWPEMHLVKTQSLEGMGKQINPDQGVNAGGKYLLIYFLNKHPLQ